MTAVTSRQQEQASRGRPRNFDEAQFLDGCIALFRSRGFSGVSISDLTAATGLTTGSIYKAYQDKEGVFASALDRYISLREARLNAHVEAAATGKEKIVVWLRDYIELSQGTDGKLGCMVVSGVTDIELLGTTADRLRAQMTKRKAALQALIASGKTDGSLPLTTATEAAAEVMLALLQGMRVVGKAAILTQDADAFLLQALKVLE